MPERTRAAVLGRPIAHSLSPVLHRAAYRALGLGWEYQALECGTAELARVLRALAADHAGVSLTMPLKLAAASLTARLDPLAGQLGAVNTVLFDGAAPHEWSGYNTDVAGVDAALREAGFGPVRGRVCLVGAGGSARAALAALVGRTGEVTCLVRDPVRAEGVVALGTRLGVQVHARALEASALDGAALVVSTLPPAGNASLANRLPGWPEGAALVDLVYEDWPTPLAALAASAGAVVVGGLATLVGQAAEAVRLMTGREAPVAAMRAAGERALAGR